MRFSVCLGLAVSLSGCVSTATDGSAEGDGYLLSSSSPIAETEGLAALCAEAGLSLESRSDSEVLCKRALPSGDVRFARLVTEPGDATTSLRVYEWEERATASLNGDGGGESEQGSGEARLGLLIEAAGGRPVPLTTIAANDFRIPTILF